MSSSSDSEDENLKNFAESVDTTVFNNHLYKNTTSEKEKPAQIEIKSQRFLDTDENIFQSELNISSTMQQFIGKKLSKLIDDQIEFEFVNTNKEEKVSSEIQVVDNMRLLSGSEEVVKYVDELNFLENRKKPIIKKRNADQLTDLSDSQKIQQAVVSVEAIAEEVKHWRKNPKREPYQYKSIKGIGYIREPTNEFTKTRNKNKWSEAKIKSAKLHSPPILETIRR